MRLRASRIGIVLGFLAAVADTPSYGQTSLQIPLQFDFLNPGAKSRAMGGAFVGLADDATATLSNPAGLMFLPRSEVSFELRGLSQDTRFLQGGRLSGAVLNEGEDTIDGPDFGASHGSDFGLGFLSGVYAKPGGRWAVAAYRHELVRVDQEFLSNGVFQRAVEELTSRRDSPQEGIRSVSMTGYGGTASYLLTPELALGASVTVYDFDIDSTFRRFDIQGFLGPPNLDVQVGESQQTGRDVSVAPTFGAIYGITGRLRLGVTYRHGPSFTFQTKDGNDPERDVTFRTPHTIAVGTSVRLGQSLTLATEVAGIFYSRLREEFITDQARAVARESSFTVSNGVELHFGVQYYPTTRYAAPKFRAGAWFDPDHSVKYEPAAQPSTISDRLFDERLSTALSTGRNLWHGTFGVGFSFTPSIELNFAGDISSTTRVLSCSMVLRPKEERP